MTSFALRATTNSFFSLRGVKELIQDLKAMRVMASSGNCMTVYYSQPQSIVLPYFMVLLRSQLRWKFSRLTAWYLAKNLLSLLQLSYFCRKMLLPTCQMKQWLGSSGGLTEKLRMGAAKKGLQCQSFPKKAEDALEKKLSPFSALLYLYFTLHSLSLYSISISCPVRYPMINSACSMMTEVLLGLTVRETTQMVAMNFLARMLVRGTVEVIILVISDLQGQTVSTYETLSAAMMKWRSWVEQVVETRWKGKPATLSFLISDFATSLLYSFSIINIMDHNSDDLVGLTMHMSIKWQWNISFVFESWTVLEDQVGLIILGMALTILVSILSVALPALKGRVTSRLFKKKYNNSTLLIKERDTVVSENEDDEKPQSCGEHLFGFLYIFVYSLFHIATMMLIMTYNGYVVIAVIAGLTLGYAIFGMQCDKDKNIPVNCCA